MGLFWEWATTGGDQPETAAEYCRKIGMYVGYAFAHICIGAANVLTLAYSMATKDTHAFLCTIGWQFFVAEAILVICYSYCNPLYKHHKRVIHMFLMILGLICISCGSALIVYISGIGGIFRSIHGIVGFVAFVMTMVASLAGPFAATKYMWPKAIHGIIALPTYLAATACLITGLFTGAFRAFAQGLPVVILMVGLILFYSLFIALIALVCVTCTVKKVCKKKQPGQTSTA